MNRTHRTATARELRKWNIDAQTLRGLLNAAVRSEEKRLVVDDVFNGTAWKRGQAEAPRALILTEEVLAEALKPYVS